MNQTLTTVVGALSLLTGTTCAQSSSERISAQSYANVAIDGWTLLDGGAGSGERGFGLFDLGVDFVFSERLEGHVGGFIFAGDRDVDRFTGDFGVFSNILTEARYTLFTAWLQHSFGDAHLRFGQLSSDETFYVSESGSLFLNSNFGAIPTVSANVAAPIFSVGAAGLEYRKSLDAGYFQVGAYAGDPGPGDRNDHGMDWRMGGDSGYFFIAERSWSYPTLSDQQGEIKVGAYFHSGQFESFTNGSTKTGHTAIYGVLEQPLSENISFFGRIGFNPDSEYSVIDRYADIGFNWIGVLSNRPRDVFGMAYSHSHFSPEFRDAIFADEGRSISSEQVIEITYQAGIASGWQIQPSIQYILDPYNANEDAIVAGIRLSASY